MPRASAVTAQQSVGGIPRGSTLSLLMYQKLGEGTEYGFTDYGKGHYTEAHPIAGTYQRRWDGYNNVRPRDKKKSKRYLMQIRDCTPNNPNTPRQKATRTRFKEAMTAWQSLQPSQKKAWNKQASGRNLYGMHLFLKEKMRELKARDDALGGV